MLTLWKNKLNNNGQFKDKGRHNWLWQNGRQVS